MAAKRIWTEIYRPRTLEEYVFQNESHKAQLSKFVREKEIPHLLLSGTQGSGKTTVARILINELHIDEADVLDVNASKETGVDFVRDKIIPFAELYPINSPIKIVHLAEFDYMSLNAQGMLRDVLEANEQTCRFICTCNYENKIIPALKSRFQQLRFTAPSRDDVLIRMAEILMAENVDFDLEHLEKYVDQAYPDLRKIINNLQLNTDKGSLASPSAEGEGGDYKFKLLDLLSSGDLRGIRQTVSEQCTGEQLLDVYEFLYRNLNKHPGFKEVSNYEQALVILNDGLYKHTLVAIPHLNFEATMIRMFNLVGE